MAQPDVALLLRHWRLLAPYHRRHEVANGPPGEARQVAIHGVSDEGPLDRRDRLSIPHHGRLGFGLFRLPLVKPVPQIVRDPLRHLSCLRQARLRLSTPAEHEARVAVADHNIERRQSIMEGTVVPLWAIVTIGGPIILGLAIAYGIIRD